MKARHISGHLSEQLQDGSLATSSPLKTMRIAFFSRPIARIFIILQIPFFLLCWLYHMGLLDGLKKAISTAGAQITSSSPNPQGIYFTNNFQHKAKAWGLSEKDALDVYYHGTEMKPGMKVRKYTGYELSIYYGYGQRKTTRQPYISTIWKRERR